jgi:hypothetical protein
MAKPSMENLDKLIAESEQSLARLESMQNKANQGIGQRMSSHMKRNSGHMINVILAGSVFVVAISRLNEKYAHQVRSWSMASETAWGLCRRSFRRGGGRRRCVSHCF